MDATVLLMTAGAVFFLASAGIRSLRRAFTEYESRYLANRVHDLSEMFCFIGPGHLVALTAAITALGGTLGYLWLGPIGALTLVVLSVASPTWVISFYRYRRLIRFDRQLVDALGLMASTMRAGKTFRASMEELARTAEAPLGQEFGLTVREMRLGETTDDALENLSRRVSSDDLELVVVAINTARSVGGNLAEILDRISATMRERIRIEGRIRALTAQGRMQGIVIGCMPIVVWIAFDVVRPDLTRPMMSHVFGYSVLGLVVVMVCLGALFLRRLLQVQV